MSRNDTLGCAGAIVLVVAFLAIVVAVGAGVGALVWAIWNAAVVPAFDAPAITFWQAWGLWTLIALVGGAFRAVVNAGGKR